MMVGSELDQLVAMSTGEYVRLRAEGKININLVNMAISMKFEGYENLQNKEELVARCVELTKEAWDEK
jgi:hypothetical protein